MLDQREKEILRYVLTDEEADTQRKHLQMFVEMMFPHRSGWYSDLCKKRMWDRMGASSDLAEWIQSAYCRACDRDLLCVIPITRRSDDEQILAILEAVGESRWIEMACDHARECPEHAIWEDGIAHSGALAHYFAQRDIARRVMAAEDAKEARRRRLRRIPPTECARARQ